MHRLPSFLLRSVVVLSFGVPCAGAELCVNPNGTHTELGLCGGQPFHTTESVVTDARLVSVPGSEVVLVLWNEASGGANPVPFYAISENGAEVQWVRRTSYDLKLEYASFDPLVQPPSVAGTLAAGASNELYLVQFVTQPLAVFRAGLTALGAKVYDFVSNHTYIVAMNDTVKTQVTALPYVRATDPYHPAYRLEAYLRDNLDRADELFPLQRYNIRVFERGSGQ